MLVTGRVGFPHSSPEAVSFPHCLRPDRSSAPVPALFRRQRQPRCSSFWPVPSSPPTLPNPSLQHVIQTPLPYFAISTSSAIFLPLQSVDSFHPVHIPLLSPMPRRTCRLAQDLPAVGEFDVLGLQERETSLSYAISLILHPVQGFPGSLVSLADVAPWVSKSYPLHPSNRPRSGTQTVRCHRNVPTLPAATTDASHVAPSPPTPTCSRRSWMLVSEGHGSPLLGSTCFRWIGQHGVV